MIFLSLLQTILVFLFLSPSVLWAEGGDASSSIEIKGLTFSCLGCKKRDDGFCIISQEGEGVLLPCADALTELLRQTESHASQRSSPAPDALWEYLLREEVGEGRNTENQERTFFLLIRTSPGRVLLLENAEVVLSRFPALFLRVLQKTSTAKIWEEKFFSKSLFFESESVSRIQALLASRGEMIGLTGLLETLSASQPKSDMRKLEVFEEETKGSLFSTPLRKIQVMLQECVLSDVSFTQLQSCVRRAHNFDSLGFGDAKWYLERALFQNVLRRRERGRLNIQEFFSLLSVSQVEKLRTPETHRLVLEALMQVERFQKKDVQKEILQEPVLSLLYHFSKNDSEIKASLSRLLPRPERKMSFGSLIPYGLVLVGGLVLLGFVQAFRRYPRRAETQGGLNMNEREELYQLLSFFKLSPNIGAETEEAHLTAQYRVLAKTLHPDTGSGSIEEFTSLGEKYNRAKELLHHRHQ